MNTFLIHAVKTGNLESVKFVVELAGVDVNWTDRYDKTPLVYGAENGHLEVVKFLVEVGAKIIIDPEDAITITTPLHEAAKNGHLEVVKFLISTKVDIVESVVEDCEDPSPLHLAIEGGHFELVKYFVEDQNANIEQKCLMSLDREYDESEECTVYPLHIAAANGHLEIVEYLVKRGVDANKYTSYKHTALSLAAKNNHLKVIEFLLDNGAKIKVFNNNTPLHVAARSGNLELIKYFVSKDPNIIETIEANNGNDSELLSDAAIGGNLELIKFLVEHGVDIKTGCHGALNNAARNGHLEALKFFLERGFDNCAEKIGASPFLSAAANGHLEVLKFFLEHGFNIRARGSDYSTALHYAAGGDQSKVIEFLLERGLGIEVTDFLGQTPLHFAVESGCLKATKILLERGANVQAKTREGLTVLMIAVNSHHLDRTVYEILHCLLKYKPDTNAIDNEGKTALGHAMQKNGREIPILLLSGAGGKITDSMLDRLPVSVDSMFKHESHCSSLEKAWGALNILNALMESQKEHAIAIRGTWSKELIPIIQKASSSIVDQSIKQGSNILHKFEEKDQVLKLQKDIKTLLNKGISSELSDQLKEFLVSTKKEIKDLDEHLSNLSCHAFEKAAEGLATKEDKDGSTVKNKKAAEVLAKVSNAYGSVEKITSFLDPKDHGKFLIATRCVKDQHLTEDARSSDKRFQGSEPENSRDVKHHCAPASSEKPDSVEKMDVVGDVCSHDSDI